MNISKTIEKIKALDLSRVKNKLMNPHPEGEGWSKEQVDEAELWYKRFLHRYAANPTSVDNVPSLVVDKFWHFHILDTAKYASDCEQVFGHFLHHNPYYGIEGDAEARDASFKVSNEWYSREFGESSENMLTFPAKEVAKCGPSGACNTISSPAKCGPAGACNTVMRLVA